MRNMAQQSENQDDTIWDVAVIGGGAAGMMAAGRAAEMGARVVLLEKNKIARQEATHHWRRKM